MEEVDTARIRLQERNCVDLLDRDCRGGLAPEGSPERIEARRALFLIARRQLRMRDRPIHEWVAAVRQHAPQLIAAAGPADVERIARVAWGLR